MGADLPLPPSSSFGRPSGARPTPTQTSVPPTNSFSRTLASPSQTSHPSAEYANPRQQRFIEATLAKTNPGSTLQPTFSPLPYFALSFSLPPSLPVDQVEGKRERNRKWWKELRPEDDTRRGDEGRLLRNSMENVLLFVK